MLLIDAQRAKSFGKCRIIKTDKKLEAGVTRISSNNYFKQFVRVTICVDFPDIPSVTQIGSQFG